MKDDKLWSWFSKYIRLRDADKDGNCSCFTCGRVGHWKQFDCGHGIGRQHKATKYNEMNNHAQCKKCNGFEEGRKDVYSKRVDEIYGDGTWDKMLILSKQTSRLDKHVIETFTEVYKFKAKELAKEKGQSL